MLTTSQLHIDGRHHTLLPATTVEAHKAEVLLIQADGQERRTALALALSGRMKPSSGSVSLGHDGSMAALRQRSAIVDSPDVNAPEHHLTVRSLVSEDLALVPLAFRDRTRPTAWLVKHGFRDILEQWVEALAPGRLLHLQLELALANQFVDLLVVDSPDRHTADPSVWLPLLQQAAAGELGHAPDAPADTPPRPLMVIGVVGRLPDDWTGPSALAGNATAGPVTQAQPAPEQTNDAEDPGDPALTERLPVAEPGPAAPDPAPHPDPAPSATEAEEQTRPSGVVLDAPIASEPEAETPPMRVDSGDDRTQGAGGQR
ncbi:ABC transporter ATP-binding protein [Arthrobacter sp. GMC3]|uniref:ABC transporter ATP-binding protein n=1 Tax=Arthrobacter sp. GMC3 TaxID=2058894 RepID=UPI0015E4682C|nr:ABC transporter ATP-binding protein [Arthrobacter sp. GMC3]